MPRISAGIVSYNPDISRLKENINSILPQVEVIFIVDNSSENIDEIKKLCIAEPKVELIENDDNYGIAKALNQMSFSAYKAGYDWILTLDQDTVSPHDLILKMQPYMDDKELGIICPAVYYEGWEKCTATKEPTTYVYACMTSASLTRVEAWEKVGGFKEEYFIDFVDNEFCMRLKIHGYKVMRVNGCVIHHRLGVVKHVKFLGLFKINIVVHAPWRFYYIVRNYKLFIDEYKAILPVTKERIKLMCIISKAILVNDKRKDTSKYIYYGLKDARRRVYGKMEGVDRV